MRDLINPSEASIDGLIGWLRQRRVTEPHTSLADLLTDHHIDNARLVDLACIDLIERRRMGHRLTVETYLAEFPRLAGDSTRLDLIDAELCVSRELGSLPELADYLRRFPDLDAPIRELFNLDVTLPKPPGQLLDVDREAAADLSVDVRSQRMTTEPDADFPVPIPAWFHHERPVACRPGSWLIQGRDIKRGVTLAMKVLELPSLSTEGHDGLLDACEAAAGVRNPVWVGPSVATISGRFFAVIRPWVFATPWTRHAGAASFEKQLQQLAAVAFAIQSAHDVGSTHGGIHANNLFLDHEGQMRLVDAVCSVDGLPRRLGGGGGPPETAHVDRIVTDVQSLITLVVSRAVEWGHLEDRQLCGELSRIAERSPGDACGRIGDHLMRLSDRPPVRPGRVGMLKSTGWRARLGQWLLRD